MENNQIVQSLQNQVPTISQTPINEDGATLISKAKAEREALVKENERLEKNIAALREVETSRLLGSTSGGNIPWEQHTEEEIKKKAAIDFWKGTPIADAIVKYG